MTEFESKLKSLMDEGVVITPDYPDDYYIEEKRRTPIFKWTSIKENNQLHVFDTCKDKKTNLIESICGIVSGGLVCWDVDSKHKNGFDAIILNDFKNLYPDLFEKMRVERTPSGGLHFYYRITGYGNEFPRGGNIASRKTTKEEQIIKPNEKSVCFLEFKASTQLSRCYPSFGYTRIKENLGTLTWEEHCCIYEHCKFYHEIIVSNYIKPSSTYQNRYIDGENPFQHFDKSNEGANVLIEDGWIWRDGGGANFDWYKKKWKPQTKEVGATFNKSTRLYKIYTSKADVDIKSYSPSNLLCILKYGGNKKSLYEHLVSQGFGSLKKEIEYSIIKARALDNLDPPDNFSLEGRIQLEEEKQKHKQSYPYGTFWKDLEDGAYKISRDDLYKVSKELGFRKFKSKIVYISGYIIKYVLPEFYYNSLKNYIISGGYNLELINTYESFLQASGEFTISRLEDLDKSIIVRSSKKESLKFYKNCYVKITKEDVEICSYNDIEGIIWDTDIKQRDFELVPTGSLKDSTYYTFLKNAIGCVDSYLLKCIGFYAHDHRDEDGYMVICTEQCENPDDGGGSGKNIFWALFNCTTTLKSTPAVLVNLNTNLLQSWDGQRIFVASDMPRNFEITFFKDIITGNATVNKKYINEFEVEIEDMCKIGGSSNFSFDNSDPGIRRRVRPIEFTNYYTLRGGVNVANNGRVFPKDWDEVEYLHFDNFIILAIQEYLAFDSKIDKKELSDGGWNKQFMQKFNHLYDFIKINIEGWLKKGNVRNEDIMDIYGKYCVSNNIFGKWCYKMQTMNKAMVEYCKHHKIGLDWDDYQFKENTINIRGKRFYIIDEDGNEILVKKNDDTPF